MVGTRPIFNLVPVTRELELSEAVATAQYLRFPTVVKKCVVASNSRHISGGMETPSFRQVALQHYTAFRTLAEAHRSVFLILVEVKGAGRSPRLITVWCSDTLLILAGH